MKSFHFEKRVANKAHRKIKDPSSGPHAVAVTSGQPVCKVFHHIICRLGSNPKSAGKLRFNLSQMNFTFS